MLEIDESHRELIIPEFEAYRTGLPEIRKILKQNDVILRAQYFTYNDCDYVIKDEINPVTTGTSGNLKKIDTAYQNGAFIDISVPTGKGLLHQIYIYKDYKIVFLGHDRTPILQYKPIYSSRSSTDISIYELIEVHHGLVYQFGQDQLENLKVLCKLLPKLIKYSP
jgi:hypothetical protein